MQIACKVIYWGMSKLQGLTYLPQPLTPTHSDLEIWRETPLNSSYFLSWEAKCNTHFPFCGIWMLKAMSEDIQTIWIECHCFFKKIFDWWIKCQDSRKYFALQQKKNYKNSKELSQGLLFNWSPGWVGFWFSAPWIYVLWEPQLCNTIVSFFTWLPFISKCHGGRNPT